MSEPFSIGTLIAYWDARRLVFGRVRNHQKDRLEIITDGKKKLKIANARIGS